MRHAYGHAHIHADCDCDGNCHIHANGHSNGYTYTDSYANGHSNSYAYTYGDGDSYRYGDSNCDCERIAAAYTDAATSADTAAPTLGCWLFISLGTREQTSRVPEVVVEQLCRTRQGTEKSSDPLWYDWNVGVFYATPPVQRVIV